MKNNKLIKILFLSLSVVVVLLIAGNLRWHALSTLNVDYDEDDYLRAAQEYAPLIRAGDWKGFLDTNYRPEHPPFAKIVFGISILNQKEYPLILDRSTTAEPDRYIERSLLHPPRVVNAVVGTITAGILAIINPIAGLMLAIHSFTIKYVSEVMLESIPAFTSLLSVFFYVIWKKKSGHSKTCFGWLSLSALFLGITAASKYLYCVAGLAVAVDMMLDLRHVQNKRVRVVDLLLWGIIALAFFVLFDPYLWPDPIGRLKESILFHTAYSTGAAEVQHAGFPVWQPFIWLFTTPRAWQPMSMPVAIDPIITFLAFFGLTKLWRKQKVYILWLSIAILFLLVWPTKWPQYIVILTAPLCLAAAEGIAFFFFDPIKNLINRIKEHKHQTTIKTKNEIMRALPWLIPGAILFIIIILLPILYQFGVSLTDFNSVSIRDGLTGGLLREVLGGLTGQIHPSVQQFESLSTKVSYIGLRRYLPVMEFLTSNGILVNNILWMVVSVMLQTAVGLFIAIILWQKGTHFKRFWQILFVLPWAIPEMIGALLWVNIFRPTSGWLALGVLQYGSSFPFAGLSGWESSMDKVAIVLLISGVWYGLPFMMLAASAGLKLMPAETLDSAMVDGANGWQVFKYLVWPLLLPLIIPAVIIRGIFAFNQFYLFQAFRLPQGTLATLSYNIFNDGQYSIAAVLNILTMLILVFFVTIFTKRTRAEEGVTYA